MQFKGFLQQNKSRPLPTLYLLLFFCRIDSYPPKQFPHRSAGGKCVYFGVIFSTLAYVYSYEIVI